MTQDERWMVRYNEVKAFIEGNKRRPSKYALEERNAWNWLRHTQKQYGSGELHCSSRFTDMLCDAQAQYRDYSELDMCPMCGMWGKEGGE